MFGYTLNWNRRNDPVTPTRGFDLSIAQDVAGLGGELNYMRTEIEGGVYYGFLPGLRASARLSAGYIFGWGGDDIRINDRFFKGGSSFRGFDVAGIGPRQLQVVRNVATDETVSEVVGDAVGGNAYYIGTIQLDFPTGLPESFGIEAALFTEFGGLGIVDIASRRSRLITEGNIHTLQYVDDALSLRAAAGLSLFWDSPFGPVQFDFAQPLAYEEYDRRESFRFSTRTRF
jgi:outer membrane protein insertion porin family